MSTVIKSYIPIVLIILAVFIFAGIISVTIDVQNARDFHAAYVNEIENSNHAGSVIEACKAEAEENGYELVVDSYTNNSLGENNSTISKVVLKYDYTIGILNVNSAQEIVGYAR